MVKIKLIEEIKNGESKTIEFKEKLPSNDSIVKSVIAFSNTSGGKLIIGINDNREIVGISDVDIFELQDKISSTIFDSCSPNIIPEMYMVNIEGKLLLVVEIFRGNLLPYYLKNIGKNNGTYIRVGATNRKAGIENIIELERQRVNISFDEEINFEYKFSTLDIKDLKVRLGRIGKELTTEKMISLKLIKEQNKELFVTNALLILLGVIENATTKCSRFKGKDMSVFLDKKEYSGSLFMQLESIEAFIKNHINLKGEIKGLQRIDTYEIPEVAIREALINAFVHRDYSNFGRDIKVGIYDDRLEIVSPGGLPNGLSNEYIFSGRSEIRNRVIARVFKELGYIEQWGSGINRIKASCLEHGLKEPVIEESGDFVGVRIFREEQEIIEEKLTSDRTATESDRTATESDRIIEEFLKTHISFTRKELMEILSIKDTKAKEILNEMMEKGLIVRKGQAKNTHYILADKI